MKNSRCIAQTAEQIGGEDAFSELPETYEGPAKLCYRGHRQMEWAIFPNQQEANIAAAMAIRPDIGGYTDVSVRAPAEGENITHQSAVEWLTDT